jgi:hypothetical protein
MEATKTLVAERQHFSIDTCIQGGLLEHVARPILRRHCDKERNFAVIDEGIRLVKERFMQIFEDDRLKAYRFLRTFLETTGFCGGNTCLKNTERLRIELQKALDFKHSNNQAEECVGSVARDVEGAFECLEKRSW